MTFGTKWFKDNAVEEDNIDRIARIVEGKRRKRRWATFIQRGNPDKRHRTFTYGLDELAHLYEPPFSRVIKFPKALNEEDLELYYVAKLEREMEK